MQIEASKSTVMAQQQSKTTETIDTGRKDLKKGEPDLEKSSAGEQGGVQPEEILNQIKSLTENGLYSVRFENSQEFDELIVKIVDNETDKVIRQVPAEEILGVKASLAELRGKLIDTVR